MPESADSADLVRALEDECARANTLIGLLRLAAKENVMAGENYDLYLQYRESRDRRFTIQQAAENGRSEP